MDCQALKGLKDLKWPLLSLSIVLLLTVCFVWTLSQAKTQTGDQKIQTKTLDQKAKIKTQNTTSTNNKSLTLDQKAEIKSQTKTRRENTTLTVDQKTDQDMAEKSPIQEEPADGVTGGLPKVFTCWLAGRQGC